MKVELDAGAASPLRISAYGPRHVIVAGIRHEKNIILTADGVISGWGPATAGDLQVVHCQELLRLAPEVVLVGTGPGLVFPPPEVMDYLPAHGIGVEFMDTGAACRAYNFLLGDARRVAAALLLG